MYVSVNEAGQQCCVAQVEDFCSGGMLDRCADCADEFALDEDLAGRKHHACIYLEQAGGVEHNGRRGGLLRGGGKRSSCKNGKDEQ